MWEPMRNVLADKRMVFENNAAVLMAVLGLIRIRSLVLLGLLKFTSFLSYLDHGYYPPKVIDDGFLPSVPDIIP